MISSYRSTISVVSSAGCHDWNRTSGRGTFTRREQRAIGYHCQTDDDSSPTQHPRPTQDAIFPTRNPVTKRWHSRFPPEQSRSRRLADHGTIRSMSATTTTPALRTSAIRSSALLVARAPDDSHDATFIPLASIADGRRTPSVSPSKPRSLSDAPKPSLSPSPAFREPSCAVSKDDSSVAPPTTPRRPNALVRGLSLQMPHTDLNNPKVAGLFGTRMPLSPKLDSSQTYGSPTSMLPRRSRGLDYTRACTNLHHSTLAESSPDSSPTITGRGMQIPQRRTLGSNSTAQDSPSNTSNTFRSTTPGNTDWTALSSSVSSVNMIESDPDSGSTSEEDLMDRDGEDPMLSTPQASKLSANFMSSMVNSPGGEWMNSQPSPAAASLMSFQRARLRKARTRHSSSSASSGNCSKPGPGPLSPPLMKSIETSNGNYFGQGWTRQQVQSRRESLSLGTGDLHLSDSEDNENKMGGNKSSSGHAVSASSADGPVGVVRRPVTRRSNLLVSSPSKALKGRLSFRQPKTKTFARIRAALFEEAAPVDSEARREAEVIHQVRENDPTVQLTASPVPQPPNPLVQEASEHTPEEDMVSQDILTTIANDDLANTFGQHAAKNSGGRRFWDTFDERHRTPPPPLLPRESSLVLNDESMEIPSSTNAAPTGNPALKGLGARSHSSTPMPSIGPSTAADFTRKLSNKRRRDDDFDPASFKRRAVSPGVSVQSSPVLPQSPVFNDNKSWGHPPAKTNGHVDRSNSGGSLSGNGGHKRVGLQGMTETHDGLMNMSIE